MLFDVVEFGFYNFILLHLIFISSYDITLHNNISYMMCFDMISAMFMEEGREMRS